MISAVLAAAFSWPFAYVTNYPALVVLSIFTGLGCGGALAINVVYLSEMTGPAVRGRVIMGAPGARHHHARDRADRLDPALHDPGPVPGLPVAADRHKSPHRAAAAGLADVRIAALAGVPGKVRPGPQGHGADGSAGHEAAPRAARARPGEQHTVVAEEKTNMFAVFGKEYWFRTVFMLVVFVLLYGGIVYGNASYAYLFLSDSRGYSAGLVFALTAWGGLIAAGVLRPQRVLRRPGRAPVHGPGRRHHHGRRLVRRVRHARQHRPSSSCTSSS